MTLISCIFYLYSTLLYQYTFAPSIESATSSSSSARSLQSLTIFIFYWEFNCFVLLSCAAIKLLTNVSSNVQLFIYFRPWQIKFKEVLKKLTLSVKKIRKLQMKVFFTIWQGVTTEKSSTFSSTKHRFSSVLASPWNCKLLSPITYTSARTITLFSNLDHFSLVKIYSRLYYVIFPNNLVWKFISSQPKIDKL